MPRLLFTTKRPAAGATLKLEWMVRCLELVLPHGAKPRLQLLEQRVVREMILLGQEEGSAAGDSTAGPAVADAFRRRTDQP